MTDKPFSCEFCDYKGKTQHDVKGHMRVHYEEVELNCTDPGCSFKCRAQSTMKLHFMKKHRNTEPNYVCHLCDKRYNRGAHLTKHLIKVHNFSWPSGHSRFRYNRDETTGLYRLQTIRFESLDLQQELRGAAVVMGSIMEGNPMSLESSLSDWDSSTSVDSALENISSQFGPLSVQSCPESGSSFDKLEEDLGPWSVQACLVNDQED